MAFVLTWWGAFIFSVCCIRKKDCTTVYQYNNVTITSSDQLVEETWCENETRLSHNYVPRSKSNCKSSSMTTASRGQRQTLSPNVSWSVSSWPVRFLFGHPPQHAIPTHHHIPNHQQQLKKHKDTYVSWCQIITVTTDWLTETLKLHWIGHMQNSMKFYFMTSMTSEEDDMWLCLIVVVCNCIDQLISHFIDAFEVVNFFVAMLILEKCFVSGSSSKPHVPLTTSFTRSGSCLMVLVV